MTIGKDAVNELDRKLASKLESIVTEEMSRYARLSYAFVVD